MKDYDIPLLLPGIKINTSPTNFSPMRSVQLAKFDTDHWSRFGELLSEGDGA